MDLHVVEVVVLETTERAEEVVVLETTERAEMETNQDGHYLSVRQSCFPIPMFLSVGFEGHFFHVGIKFLEKSSAIQKISIILSLDNIGLLLND